MEIEGRLELQVVLHCLSANDLVSFIFSPAHALMGKPVVAPFARPYGIRGALDAIFFPPRLASGQPMIEQSHDMALLRSRQVKTRTGLKRTWGSRVWFAMKGFPPAWLGLGAFRSPDVAE